MKPITASSTNNKHNPAPSLGGNSLPGLLTKITEQTQGSSAGWGCKKPSSHPANPHFNHSLGLFYPDLNKKMGVRSQNLSGKRSHYSETSPTPACLLCYLHPSRSECSSIKSKADPLQEPTPPGITCQLRKTSLKGAVNAELKIF